MADGAYTVTVNADARFYLDGGRLENGGSLVDTVTKFNDAKISLYNALYDKKYLGTGPLHPSGGGQTHSAFLKEKFGINDYYCAAVYAEASAVLKSQAELYGDEIKGKEAGLNARKEKIKGAKDALDRKRRVKEAVKEGLLTGNWGKLRPGTVRDGHVFFAGRDCGAAEDYERKLETGIRRLGTRVRLLEEALLRAQAKLEKRKKEGVRRAIFGGKAFYKTKDAGGADMVAWKEEYRFRRHRSMALPGRHTSACGNFLALYDQVSGDLRVRCMDGKEAVFRSFRPARFREEFLSLFGRDPRDREAVPYRFLLHKDSAGTYFTASVTMTLSHARQNAGFDSGCVAIDLNPDRIAVADIGEGGELGKHFSIPLRLGGKTSGQAACAIGEAMARVGAYCRERKKCLVMEDLDFTAAKQGLKYGNRARNRTLSMFAFRKMSAGAASQAYKHSFTVYTVNPAYTSAAGKLLYMRKYGCPVHEAAAYVIGLSAMGLKEKYRPPEWMTPAEEAGKKEKGPGQEKGNSQGKASTGNGAEAGDKKPRHTVYKNQVVVKAPGSVAASCGKQWRALLKRIDGIPLHGYYMKIDDSDWGKKKRTVGNYFKVLKAKVERQALIQKVKADMKRHVDAGGWVRV